MATESIAKTHVYYASVTWDREDESEGTIESFGVRATDLKDARRKIADLLDITHPDGRLPDDRDQWPDWVVCDG